MTERLSPRAEDAQREAGAEKIRRERMRLDMLHALVFDTPEGKQLLAHFRQITIERRNPPGDSDGALREFEACRNFVAKIEQAIARHHAVSSER